VLREKKGKRRKTDFLGLEEKERGGLMDLLERRKESRVLLGRGIGEEKKGV